MRLQRRWRKASVLPFCPVAGCTRAEALLTSLSNTCPSHSRDKRRDEEEARRSRYRHFSEPGRHLPNQPSREHFDHATVLFDWFANSRGEKLRTFITPPNHTTGKVPVIFFVGWLSCDGMEYPDRGTHDGFGILLRRRIDESGYATVRMDKPAAGKSQGECAKADSGSRSQVGRPPSMARPSTTSPTLIVSSLSAYATAADSLPGTPRAPGARLLLLSLLGRTWYGHRLELERRRPR